MSESNVPGKRSKYGWIFQVMLVIAFFAALVAGFKYAKDTVAETRSQRQEVIAQLPKDLVNKHVEDVQIFETWQIKNGRRTLIDGGIVIYFCDGTSITMPHNNVGIIIGIALKNRGCD